MPDHGDEWNRVGEPPGIYPADLWDWYECYYPNPPGKLAHDAMLYLAESGVRHLATIAYSIALSTQEPGRSAFSGRHLSFGTWVDVLRECAPAVPGWNFSEIDPSLLPACGRLRTVSSTLDELQAVDNMTPILKSLGNSPKKLSWWSAWNALVEYRNKTLGHPNARILKTPKFHEVLTEVVAAAVSELLWNDVVAEAIGQHRIASFKTRTTGTKYEVEVRTPNRMQQTRTLAGEEGGNFEKGDELILSHHGGRLDFHCRKQNPEDEAPSPVRSPSDAVIATPGTDGPYGSAAAEVLSRSAIAIEGVQQPISQSVPTVAVSAEFLGALRSCGLPFVDMTVVVPTTFAITDNHGESHEIEMTESFLVALFPVTQLLYKYIMNENPSCFLSDSNPVEFVSWVGAVSFCNKLSAMSGLKSVYQHIPERGWRVDATMPGFRLLMEDEWAYCCSVGYEDASDATPLGGKATTLPVDSGAGNRLGLYCMLGNVWEWCNDIYRAGYSAAPVSRVIEPDSGSPRVIRGGSFVERPGIISPSSRFKHPARARQKNIGFRIGRSLPERLKPSTSEAIAP